MNYEELVKAIIKERDTHLEFCKYLGGTLIRGQYDYIYILEKDPLGYGDFLTVDDIVEHLLYYYEDADYTPWNTLKDAVNESFTEKRRRKLIDDRDNTFAKVKCYKTFKDLYKDINSRY